MFQRPTSIPDMLYLAIIFHMHQPYYKNLLTQESLKPWVRLHGIKDYMDMVEMLKDYPSMRLTFNLVPSLLEQVEDYTTGAVKDKFLEMSYKPAAELNCQDKQFLYENFFSINKDKVIALSPRYYDLYLKKQAKKPFTPEDYLDLQVWFNLAWFDPSFRQNIPELNELVKKARFFDENDKHILLEKQLEVLEEIIPTYRKYMSSGQIESILSPFYHPILPLLYSTNLAREANPKMSVPKIKFSYPADVKAQIENAINFFKEKLGREPVGMWPSEESVCEHILPEIIQSGIKWVVTDEAILFKSLKKKKRDTALLYQPHLLKREEGNLNIV
ncbi:MAG: glycoside hydrolase family 57, partial [Candidatus Omnitrophica bacterium]|nr:glycoside hydrolase family 57 [Candidatus Omnitrophota bacterium]